jgi:hypothetical protein
MVIHVLTTTLFYMQTQMGASCRLSHPLHDVADGVQVKEGLVLAGEDAVPAAALGEDALHELLGAAGEDANPQPGVLLSDLRQDVCKTREADEIRNFQICRRSWSSDFSEGMCRYMEGPPHLKPRNPGSLFTTEMQERPSLNQIHKTSERAAGKVQPGCGVDTKRSLEEVRVTGLLQR